MSEFKIVDLFAGIGGLRSGVVNSLIEREHKPEVIFTSEIKPTAVKTLQANYSDEIISGDITKISVDEIPSHNILLAGFPCQAFSFAGTRKGFNDTTKGTLFFDVARILESHQPEYFILENVEGLIHHDPYPNDKSLGYGRTFTIILEILNSLNYNVDWEILNATDFGVPQARKRVIIVGSKNSTPKLSELVKTASEPLSSVLEQGISEPDEKVKNLSSLLLSHYSPSFLLGKVIRDKRGGTNNIHSWNIEYKGTTTSHERSFMEDFLIQTRKKKWSVVKGIPFKECTPLTLEDIKTFASKNDSQSVENMVDNLTHHRYLIKEEDPRGGADTYRIYSGRLTLPLSHILSPEKYTQTLVATDADRLGVFDNGNIRRLSDIEVKRLFGFPDDFIIDEKFNRKTMFDLFGNSVVIPVAKAVADLLIK